MRLWIDSLPYFHKETVILIIPSCLHVYVYIHMGLEVGGHGVAIAPPPLKVGELYVFAPSLIVKNFSVTTSFYGKTETKSSYTPRFRSNYSIFYYF